jgi:hypothetical protein
MKNFAGNTNSPDRLLTVEEAEELLKPYVELLNRCIQHGWDAYQNDYATKHHLLSARSRATIVFDEIIARAEQEFNGIDGVKFVRKSNSFMLYIGDKATVRFKKIRKSGRCSNIDTRQQVLFKAQAQFRLPGMLEGTLLHAGYLLNDIERDIRRKMVVCQLNNRVLWQFELRSEAAAQPVITMQPKPQPPQPQKPRFVVKPSAEEVKKPKAKDAKAGE